MFFQIIVIIKKFGLGLGQFSRASVGCCSGRAGPRPPPGEPAAGELVETETDNTDTETVASGTRPREERADRTWPATKVVLNMDQ